MRTAITTILLLLTAIAFSQTKAQKDFLFYWQTVADNFAYFGKQKTDWQKVKTIYQPIADTITTRNSLIHLLEKTNNDLYNGHVFLNSNTASSNRTIPTGADLKVSFVAGKFLITEVRPGYNADGCGLSTDMTITRFDDVPVSKAVQQFLPKSVAAFDAPMYDYAATALLAGTHNKKRKITALVNGIEKEFYPDSLLNKTETNPATILETTRLPRNIGYIKINNSLGNSDLIQAFDITLDSLMNTNGLILDLRETPSGGTTTIARAIMGRFVTKEMAYQKHIYTAEEKESGIRRTTLELVSPRLKTYTKPLIVLVGYWTGSMGEGIAIGFDGVKRAKIMGTKMAGLLGEIYSFETPELKVPFSFPAVQLQHVNGQPREDFMPTILMTDQKTMVSVAAGLVTTKK